MLDIQEYIYPESIDQVLQLIQADSTILLAGGGIELISIRPKSKKIVDLTSLPLSYIKEDNEWIKIGATTRYTDIVNSEILKTKYNGIVSTAAEKTASYQIRNQATIGGNIASSNPSSDLIASLIAVNAQLKLANKKTVTITEYITSSVKDFIEEILIPAKDEGFKGSYIRVGRTEFDFPIVNIAITMKLEKNTCHDITIAMGGVNSIPFHAKKTEELFKGQAIDSALIQRGIEMIREEINPATNIRGSKEYKKELAGVLFMRAVEECLKKEGK